MLSLVVHRNGRVVFDYTRGLSRSVAGHESLTPDTLCRFYSMTKPMIAVLVLRLMERGKLHLDDPISKHIPEWHDSLVLVVQGSSCVPAKKLITIRHLLTHTAGFTYGFDLEDNTGVGGIYRDSNLDLPMAIASGPKASMPYCSSLADFVGRLNKIPLAGQPGEAFRYSVATDVLGRLVEAVTGKSLQSSLDAEITGPLKMHDTGFTITEEQLHRLAECSYAVNNGEQPGYVHADQELQRGVGSTDESCLWLDSGRHVQCPSGGGGAISTRNDYSKFAEALITGSCPHTGYQLLKPETADLMRTAQLKQMEAQSTGMAAMFQGIGLGVNTTTSRTKPNAFLGAGAGLGAGGWGGAAMTSFVVDPENRLSWVQVSQLLGYWHTMGSFKSELNGLVYRLFPELLGSDAVADDQKGPSKGFTG
eukprot:TRINITY_DN2347_c0_g1_i2.p1 TRINITY_DN2347_c0_g1~~TRINITY_DN2347_c0_g1_i2.p1  ORF type:complete len:420 (+),score=91.35 TRINITY_DN2347_c0_g1_i2:222-1481(+)